MGLISGCNSVMQVRHRHEHDNMCLMRSPFLGYPTIPGKRYILLTISSVANATKKILYPLRRARRPMQPMYNRNMHPLA